MKSPDLNTVLLWVHESNKTTKGKDVAGIFISFPFENRSTEGIL